MNRFGTGFGLLLLSPVAALVVLGFLALAIPTPPAPLVASKESPDRKTITMKLDELQAATKSTTATKKPPTGEQAKNAPESRPSPPAAPPQGSTDVAKSEPPPPRSFEPMSEPIAPKADAPGPRMGSPLPTFTKPSGMLGFATKVAASHLAGGTKAGHGSGQGIGFDWRCGLDGTLDQLLRQPDVRLLLARTDSPDSPVYLLDSDGSIRKDPLDQQQFRRTHPKFANGGYILLPGDLLGTALVDFHAQTRDSAWELVAVVADAQWEKWLVQIGAHLRAYGLEPKDVAAVHSVVSLDNGRMNHRINKHEKNARKETP